MLKIILHILVYIFALIGFVLVAGYFAIQFGLTNTNGIIDNQTKNFLNESMWQKGEEWQTLKEAIIRDKDVLVRAGKDANINPRLIVSMLVVEQLRLYHSDRELFKKAFAPLKILGNQNQFSWGVMGLKPETAKLIEENLKKTSSPYYLGEKFENILNFKTNNPDQERFERIVNDNDRYYSYLYAGLYMRQVMEQWQKAGFPISGKPDIIATLYNIGFKKSEPKPNPQSGGAEIEINYTTYSFGSLAKSFYDSSELMDIFPL